MEQAIASVSDNHSHDDDYERHALDMRSSLNVEPAYPGRKKMWCKVCEEEKKEMRDETVKV
jgi:hypothetical protein